MIINFTVLALISVALVWDVRYHKIPNKITMPAILIGIVMNAFVFGVDGVVSSLQGLLLGIAVFLIPFGFGGLGGGDVKLMGAVGALKGWVFVLHAALFTALWGGLIALLAIVITRKFRVLREFGRGLGLFVITSGKIGSDVLMPDKDRDAKERLFVPYGIAIFAGTITAYFIKLPIPG